MNTGSEYMEELQIITETGITANRWPAKTHQDFGSKDRIYIKVGKDDQGERMEVLELKDHPWFVGVQFHPELKSRIVNVHPLFRDFIAAAIEKNI